MPDDNTIKWVGKSGREYLYWIYKLGATFDAVPGNYIFAKSVPDNKLRAIYIGQTSNLSERFDNHERMPCIRRNGADYICAHKSNESEKGRCAEESDLIANYDPCCNRML
jgi:hypothetical protein